MKDFDFFLPTQITFGAGRLSEIGEATVAHGKRALMVCDPYLTGRRADVVDLVAGKIKEAGGETCIFDDVAPNPTLAGVKKGSDMAKEKGAEVIIGFGGGSAMDTAKAIAVEATHEGSAWDYLFFSDTQPTQATLPIVTIPTTSGTGSHVTKVAVITDASRDWKSALCHENIFARATVIDPELMLTVPRGVTASTGWDVITHSFESYINISAQPLPDQMALESIRLVIENLPEVLEHPDNIEARSKMAWADTLAGACIANVGTTLPHAMGQPISGHFSKVSHGQSLAVIYPAFLEYTAPASVERFAIVARLFNSGLASAPDDEAAPALKDEITGFLKRVGMHCHLDDFGISKDDVEPILKHCMEFPDVGVNPIVPDTETVRELYMKSFK